MASLSIKFQGSGDNSDEPEIQMSIRGSQSDEAGAGSGYNNEEEVLNEESFELPEVKELKLKWKIN